MGHESWPPPEPHHRRLWAGRASAPPPAAPPPPPPPGEPPPRRDNFALIAIALGLLALGAVIAALAGSGDDGSQRRPLASATATAPTTPPPTSTVPTPPLNPRHIVRRSSVGSSIPASDDGVLFQVKRLREVHSIAHNEFTGPIVSSNNKRLYRADIVYVNKTKQATDVFCGGSAAQLEDSAGHRVEPMDNYIDIEGNDDVCGGNKVLPGQTSHLTLAFKIPRPRTARGVYVHNAKAADFDGADTKIFFALP
jgi:hypothetical protein